MLAGTVTVAVVSPATAVGRPGVPGRRIGYGAEASDVPSALVAVIVTEYLYAASALRPCTTQVVAVVALHVALAGSVTTSYCRSGLPLALGASHATVRSVPSRVSEMPAGTSGTLAAATPPSAIVQPLAMVSTSRAACAAVP